MSGGNDAAFWIEFTEPGGVVWSVTEHASGSLRTQLKGRLYWGINNESYSSHACSNAILGALDEKPGFSIIQLGTGMRISMGNRGRTDVNVHVRGKGSHSSTPNLGLSAIDGMNEVLNRLKTITWPVTHPILGGRHTLAYKMRFELVAPYTLPSDAYIAVDRRMLPGDDPADAVEDVRRAIGDLSPYEVTVTQGVFMLPAMVDPEHPGVRALQAANVAIYGQEAGVYYGQGTYDTGGPCALGVPTIMFGARGGVWPNGPDLVPISAVEAEAKILLHTIFEFLG